MQLLLFSIPDVLARHGHVNDQRGGRRSGDAAEETTSAKHAGIFLLCCPPGLRITGSFQAGKPLWIIAAPGLGSTLPWGPVNDRVNQLCSVCRIKKESGLQEAKGLPSKQNLFFLLSCWMGGGCRSYLQILCCWFCFVFVHMLQFIPVASASLVKKSPTSHPLNDGEGLWERRNRLSMKTKCLVLETLIITGTFLWTAA